MSFLNPTATAVTSRSVSAWCVGVAVLVTLGCGQAAPKLTPASGVVLIDGEPAADISVQFLPDEVEGETRPTSYAVTDAQGQFTLKTYEQGDGAVTGGHNVILVDTLEERPEQGEELSQPPRLDSRYSTITGGLRADVVEGGAPIEIAVSSASEEGDSEVDRDRE